MTGTNIVFKSITTGMVLLWGFQIEKPFHRALTLSEAIGIFYKMEPINKLGIIVAAIIMVYAAAGYLAYIWSILPDFSFSSWSISRFIKRFNKAPDKDKSSNVVRLPNRGANKKDIAE